MFTSQTLSAGRVGDPAGKDGFALGVRKSAAKPLKYVCKVINPPNYSRVSLFVLTLATHIK